MLYNFTNSRCESSWRTPARQRVTQFWKNTGINYNSRCGRRWSRPPCSFGFLSTSVWEAFFHHLANTIGYWYVLSRASLLLTACWLSSIWVNRGWRPRRWRFRVEQTVLRFSAGYERRWPLTNQRGSTDGYHGWAPLPLRAPFTGYYYSAADWKVTRDRVERLWTRHITPCP